MPDAFEAWLEDLQAQGGMRPSAEELAAFRSWAADIWLSWKRWDILHPHEAEVDIARAEIDAEWREFDG